MIRSIRYLVVLGAAGTLGSGSTAGCGAAAQSETAAPQAQQLTDPCPSLGCGLNGAWLGANVAFRELDLGPAPDTFRGEFNDAGLMIASFTFQGATASDGGVPMGIDVEGDDLVGILRGDRLRGTKLRGARITLVNKQGVHYFLDINDVTSTGFWTEHCTFSPGQTCPSEERVPLYSITFTREGTHVKESVCGPATDPDQPVSGLVVIFRGDRYGEPPPGTFSTPEPYHGPGYRVRSDPTSTWFNIACAGTAIGKLHLLRHTDAAARPGVSGVPGPASTARTTTPEQRQALLKMLTADYCGIGFPFTENGHRLTYTFTQSWEPRFPQTDGSVLDFAGVPTASIDALWNEEGALCIGVPRLIDQVPPQELADRIRRRCGKDIPQECRPSDSLASWNTRNAGLGSKPRAYAISANPRPFVIAH